MGTQVPAGAGFSVFLNFMPDIIRLFLFTMDQQDVPQKKKFYKRWWFWVLVVIVLLIIIGVSAGGGSTPQKVGQNGGATAGSGQPASSGNSAQIFKVGDQVQLAPLTKCKYHRAAN
jgi:hypothetical protein